MRADLSSLRPEFGKKPRAVTVQQCRRCACQLSAAVPTKRLAKCAIAHEQADDKAEVVLLNSYAKYYCSGNLHGN